MRLRTTGLTSIGALAAALTVPGPAAADPTYGRGIDGQLYRPALDSEGIFSLETSATLPRYQFVLQLGSSFASKPVAMDTLLDASGMPDGTTDSIIDSTLAVNFGFAYGITDRLTLGFEIPINQQSLGAGFGKNGQYTPTDPDDPTTLIGTGLFSTRDETGVEPADNTPGDLRLGLKWRLFGHLAAQLVGWLPFGDEDTFTGSGGFTVEPRLVYDMGLGKKGKLAINVAARLRPGVITEVRSVNQDGQPLNDAMGNAVFYPRVFVGSEALAGVGVKFGLTDAITFGGEATVFVPIAFAADDECGDGCRNGDLTAEVVVGARVAIGGDFGLTIGGGTGKLVPDAVRTPAFRLLLGITWAPTMDGGRVASRGDSDGDGIPDGPDVCPDEPEDDDGFQDDDGCPDLDNDLDGVLDAQDKCKDDPEDRDGYDDDDGCPEGDNDADGVPDLSDRCPKDKEDKDGHDDDDGCPDEDNDGDGILDAKDQCPDESETLNGYLDLDGCPDQAAQGGPKLSATAVDLQGERVEFTGKSDRLTRGSEATLDVVAKIMKDNPRIRFRIEVGVEESGKKKRDKDADRRLTEQRAQAVRAYLVGKGVEQSQLDAAGLGSDRPIDRDPKSVKNRRVEFIRLNQ